MEFNRIIEQKPDLEKLNKFVCHSTSQENIINIIKTGKLKSINLLKKENVDVVPSSFYGRHDLEDTDFIEFAPLNTTIGENVVNARQEIKKEDNELKYKPSVRIIFSKEKLGKLSNSEIKELSIKIKGELDLGLAEYIVFPSLELYKKLENSIEDKTLKNVTSRKAIILTELESSNPDSYVNKNNQLILERLP